MDFRITIDFENDEGAVRRILGVIEQRGFEIVSIAMPGAEGTVSMTVGLKPRGEGRSIEILGRQIARLHSVQNVQTTQGQTEFERECA